MTDIEAAGALPPASDLDAEADAYRDLLAADPGNVAAWLGLGSLRLKAGAYGEAYDAARRAMQLDRKALGAAALLGETRFHLGDVESAVDSFRRAANDPALRAAAEQNIAIMIPGSALASNATILAARRDFGRRLAQGITPMARPPRPPGRKLRIGYVSSFFDRANWMKPVYGVINRHDRDRFEVHLIALGSDPSASAGYKDYDDDVVWRVSSPDDEAVAERLAQAGLDVLIDLNAYSAASWLRLFLRRPAPVQMGWFNSYATSGLDCFDAIIGDETVAPAAEAKFYTEQILRVRGTYLAFEVLHPAPDVVAPPCLSNGGRLTFGALASGYKLNDLTLGIWAKVLKEVPDTRLLIRARTLAEASTREHFQARFSALGVAMDRVDIEGGAPHFDYLRSYDRIDIALDAFPYNGGTTTMEALWQGVPVLTYSGDRWAARTSASLLKAAGLSDWVARRADTLVAKAGEFSRHPDLPAWLAALRAGMRARLLASEACNTAGLCRQLEDIYTKSAQHI